MMMYLVMKVLMVLNIQKNNNESVSNSKPKWRSPSKMTKDEITSEKMDLLYRYSRLENNGYKSSWNTLN